ENGPRNQQVGLVSTHRWASAQASGGDAEVLDHCGSGVTRKSCPSPRWYGTGGFCGPMVGASGLCPVSARSKRITLRLCYSRHVNGTRSVSTRSSLTKETGEHAGA